MAVVISDSTNASYNGNISTANGFYRVEASNLGMFSTTDLSLSTTRTIAFTPANAGNCLGAVICLVGVSGTAASAMRTVTVKLQENVASVWTDRASKALTGSEIANSSTTSISEWIVPFVFTAPYAVTAVGGTWRLEISNATGTNWSIKTSDATNPFYAVWCDNQVSFTSNADQLIVKDTVYIDQAVTFKGALGTGDTTRSVNCVVCRHTDPTPANVAQLQWDSTPASSYTLTLDGLCVLSAHGGFRAGTSGSPIPIAQAGTISIIAATSGTSTNTGFSDTDATTTGRSFGRQSIFIYGEVPATRTTQLAAHAAIGGTVTMTIADPCVVTKASHGYRDGTAFQLSTTGALPTGLTTSTTYYTRSTGASTFNVYDTYANAIAGGTTGRVATSGSQSGTHTLNTVLIVDDSTGWSIGDEIATSRHDTAGGGDLVEYTIGSISGTTIIPNANFATANRYIDGYVIKLNGYGFNITGYSSSTAVSMTIYGCSNFVMSGVYMKYITWTMGQSGSGRSIEQSSYESQYLIEDSSYKGCSTPTSVTTFMSAQTTYGAKINRFHVFRGALSWQAVGGSQPVYTITNNIFTNGSNSFATLSGSVAYQNLSNNFINNAGSSLVSFAGGNITFYGNEIWGTSSTGAVVIGAGTALINPNSWGSNTFNRCTGAFLATGTIFGMVSVDDVFGNIVANTTDININTSDVGIFCSFEFNSPTGNLVISTTFIGSTAEGTIIKISDFNDTANDDRAYLTYGEYQRCGTGLSDTTVRTSGTGKYSIRLKPRSGTYILNWPNMKAERSIPTGNIEDLTMTVTCWCYINNTAYDAGTYQLPRLNVKYDNATTTYAQATATFGSWQQLAVTFTPTTTYGQIEVWVSAATDATSTDAYVYFDDFNIGYPAGVNIDLGGLDLWASASPIWPPIATNPSLGGVWDETTAAHTVSGSFGAKVKKLLELGQYVGLK